MKLIKAYIGQDSGAITIEVGAMMRTFSGTVNHINQNVSMQHVCDNSQVHFDDLIKEKTLLPYIGGLVRQG